MNKEKKNKMAFGKRFVLHVNTKSNYGISYLVFQKHYLLSIFATCKKVTKTCKPLWQYKN